MAHLFFTRFQRTELTSRGVLFIAALAWIAGTVNAIGYLTIAQVFTSHMTGNATEIVIMLMSGGEPEALRRLAVLVAFFAGAAAGALLVESHERQSAAGALWLEAGLLGTGAVLALIGAAKADRRRTDLSGGRDGRAEHRAHRFGAERPHDWFGGGALVVPSLATAVSAVILWRSS